MSTPDHTPRLTWWQRLTLRLLAWHDRRHPHPLPTGAWGERWAARFLRLQGCRILECNARPYRRGELDIIARHHHTILFIEVKTRKNTHYGRPLHAINRAKRLRLRKAATHWLSQHHLLGTDTFYRFDAIEILGTPATPLPKINWVTHLDMSDAPPPNHL